MATVTLFFDWKYTAYGERWKRNYEYPREIKGRSKMTFPIDSTKTREEQLLAIKNEMVAYVKKTNYQDIMDMFYRRDDADEDEKETIGRDYVKIYNVREATQWTDLEDF